MSLESRMTAVLACPINWDEETTIDDAAFSVLGWDWHFTLGQHAVSKEEVDAHLDLVFEDEYYETTWDLENLEMRRQSAIEAYKGRAGRLRGLCFLTPSQHTKHAAAGLTKDAILSYTRTGPSLFYQSYSASHLKSTFWSWFLSYFDIVNSRHEYYEFVTPNTADYNSSRAKLWRKFLEEHHLRIAFDAMLPVGACRGASTSYVCFDIDINSKIAHCYPITSAEALRIMGKDDIECIDALNC